MPLARATRPRAARSASLDHPDPAERRLAVADCATAGPLFAQLAAEGDASVRHAILTRLGALAEPGLEARLLPLLASEDVALRQDAILALRRRGEAALPALEGLLAAPDPDLRIFVANILEGISHPGARAALAARLAAEADATVCLALVEALAQIGTVGEAPALQALRARFAEEPCLGFAIAIALDQMGAGA
ncbi:MAG: HEAT repeat domain-containing protein [Roseococcus sp.]|nr:HEAT repeat domain-containing protein [Roseococcus sp.]